MIKSWMFKPQETGGLPLTGWTYRKSITLSRASGAVTNYQMKLLVGESSGATGEDVDCGGHCLSSFNDIRFTTSDGTTLLDYWIESISGATPNQLATIWIEFNSIGTGATTFYMYYGNAGASAYSNGANTFIIFDHFDGASIDTGIWSVKAGDVATTGGELVLTGTTGTRGLIESITGITQGSAWNARFKTAANGYSANHVAFRQTGDWNNRSADYYGDAISANQAYFATYSGGVSTVTTAIGIPTAASFHNYVGTLEANKSMLIQDATTLVTHTTNVPAGTQYLTFYESGVVGVNLYVDWVFARNFNSTGPAWGAWGAEES